MSFDSFGLPEGLVQALDARSLNTPLPIQAAALPALMAGKSAMLVSRTGSGKTLAYLLPLLAGIDPDAMCVQAVVLAPTHELAMQICRLAADLSREAGLGIRVQSLIGGAATNRQIEGLKKKPHLVVGSAGRMIHLMELGKLKLRDATWLVLDEADRLLIEEGLEHIRRIAAGLGAGARFAFVSATEGPATTRVARELAPDLERIRVQADVNPNIRHCFLVCEERDKIDWLRKALRGLDPARALVFVHRGANAERIAERLEHHHLAVADLHGARDKFARQAALENFRRGRARVLIASDIAARGLDVAEVELVVNVDVPSQSRDYLHRAGRTGRAGAPGLVLSLMTEAERRLAGRYADDLGISVEPVRLVRGRTKHSSPEKIRPETFPPGTRDPGQRSCPGQGIRHSPEPGKKTGHEQAGGPGGKRPPHSVPRTGTRGKGSPRKVGKPKKVRPERTSRKTRKNEALVNRKPGRPAGLFYIHLTQPPKIMVDNCRAPAIAKRNRVMIYQMVSRIASQSDKTTL
jgi:superfamily II DNA/RNA helicase